MSQSAASTASVILDCLILMGFCSVLLLELIKEGLTVFQLTENSSGSCTCQEGQWHDQAEWCVLGSAMPACLQHLLHPLYLTLLCLSTHSAGTPLDLIASETLRWKCQEPVLLLGKQRFANVDIRIRAQGGGHVSQIYGVFSAAVPTLFLYPQHCKYLCCNSWNTSKSCCWNVFKMPCCLQLSDKPLPRALWRSTRNVSSPGCFEMHSVFVSLLSLPNLQNLHHKCMMSYNVANNIAFM